MPASPTTVNRTDDPTSGDDFKVYEDTNTPARLVQAVANDPEVSGMVLSWAQTAGAAAVTAASISTTAGAAFKVDVVVLESVTAARWLMVFDLGAAPTGGEDPILRARISGGFASIDLGLYGREVTAGVAVAISTAPGLLALPGSGEGFFQVGYV